MTVGLVWAQAANGVIGVDGGLPWQLPEDLARFKELTLGSTVVMGRATWESLPPAVRPLPGRRNVVLTRQPGWQAPGAVVARSLAEALDQPGDVWVIGGASVYREALPLADVVVVTELARGLRRRHPGARARAGLAGPRPRPGDRVAALAHRPGPPGRHLRPVGRR